MKTERTCAGCDEDLPPQVAPGRQRRWCSEACRLRSYRETHPEYIERLAVLAAERHRRIFVPASHDLVCIECGNGFTNSRRRQFCTESCRGRFYSRRRRAMRRASQTTAALFSLRGIARRDAWSCHICRLPVPVILSFPHPKSWSLDHLIPLAKGGKHEESNVKIAHLICNQRKGDRQ